MFNRQPFNRGKFNRSRTTDRSVYFFGNANLTLEAEGFINNVSTFRGAADIYLTGKGRLNYNAELNGYVSVVMQADGFLIRVIPFKGFAAVNVIAAGKLLRTRIIRSGKVSVIVLAASGGFNTYRYEYLKLPDLIVRVGDELIIDTDLLTVTLNGQNVIPQLSRDSEFFLFNPNVNDVIYTSGSPDDNVDIRILWKDQYL